ncbi:MAG: hypothetical protein DRH32_06940 [Deltaproteobacteria bacterium]|nr:MAG: hypothetical protein DRH32_06940 [Deltaproteobacteria bacterium]
MSGNNNGYSDWKGPHLRLGAALATTCSIINQPDISYVKTTGQRGVLITNFSFSLTQLPVMG